MKLLSLIILSLATGVSLAQTPAINNNVRASNLLNRFTEYRLTPGEMAIGISTPREVKIIGDVYLDIHWGKSSIEVFNSEKLIEGYFTRFDIKNNEVEFQIDRSVRVLPGNKVKSVVWIDSITQQPRIIENASKYVFNDVPLNGFLEILVDGKTPLLKRYFLEILKPDFSPALNVGSKDYRILKKVEYFYAIGNQLTKIKGKKSLGQLISNSEKDVNLFIKAESLNLKKAVLLQQSIHQLKGVAYPNVVDDRLLVF
jgi:hypothetical protein